MISLRPSRGRDAFLSALKLLGYSIYNSIQPIVRTTDMAVVMINVLWTVCCRAGGTARMDVTNDVHTAGCHL